MKKAVTARSRLEINLRLSSRLSPAQQQRIKKEEITKKHARTMRMHAEKRMRDPNQSREKGQSHECLMRVEIR